MNDGSVFDPDLQSGETLLWTGQPDRSLLVSRDEFVFLLVGVMFLIIGPVTMVTWYLAFSRISSPALGFATAAMATIVGLGFTLIGFFLVFGRRRMLLREKARTHYAVTDRRAIILHLARPRVLHSLDLASIDSLRVQSGRKARGTLFFGRERFLERLERRIVVALSTNSSGHSWWLVSGPPAFIDIAQVHDVAALIESRIAVQS